MSGTSSEQASRLVSFNELRTLDNNFKLVKAASDTRSSSIQTDIALSSCEPHADHCLSKYIAWSSTKTGGTTDQGVHRSAAGINMKRQIFFTQIGGFDTHSAEINGQGNLLTQVSQAINAFYAATVELGVQDKVTTFTMSDFGRTFQPAGTGVLRLGPIMRGEITN